METKPDLAIVQMIAESLRKENSNQVGSFVFSHLTSLSNSTIPCNNEISAIAKQVLRYSKPFRNGAQFSKHIPIGKMSDDLKLGAFLEINHIGQKAAPFPLSMNAKLSANILGYQTSIAEAGMRTESLHYILNNIFGTATKSNAIKKWIDDLVPVEARDKVPDPKFLGYLKIFGREIRFASLDKLIFDSITKKDFNLLKIIETKLKKLTEQLDLQKAFVLFEGTHQIASELGLPLALNITSAGVMTVNYVGRIAARPPLSEILRGQAIPKSLVIEGAIKPRLALKMTGKMGVDSIILKTGVAIDANANVNLPINGKLKVDLSEGIYDVKVKTPSENRQLVILQTKPYTFKEEEKEDITTYRNEVKKPIEGQLIKRKPCIKAISVGKESIGVEIEVRSKWISSTGVPSAPRFPLSGPVDFNITTRSGVNRPEEYSITLEVSTVNVSSEFIKESMEINTFRQWITSSSSSLEQNEGLESKSNEDEWTFVPAWIGTIIEKAKEKIMCEISSKSTGRSGRLELDDRKLSRSNEERADSKLAIRLLVTIVGIHEERTELQRKIVAELLINGNEEGFKTVTMELVQSPTKAGEIPLKLCMQNEILFPAPDFVIPDNLKSSSSGSGSDASKSGESWSDSSEEMKHLSLDERLRIMTKQVRSKLNIQWGVSCINDKKLEIKARFEQSQMQRQELKDKLNPVRIQCNKDRSDGLRFSPACLEIIKQENELRSMHVMMTYVNIPLWYRIMYSKMILLFEKETMDNLVIDTVDQKNKGGTVLISGAIDKTHTKMDLVIKHPYKTLTWHDVSLPVHLEPLSARYSLISQYRQRMFNNKFPPTCKVVKDQVKTFDDLEYNYNITTCPHILAKDCSSSGLYTVTARRSPVHSDKKEVMILTEGNTIELKPHSDVDNADIIVIVDAIPLEIRNNQQITIFSNGKILTETIFPHMDKIEVLRKKPSPITGSASSEERHIEEIMVEELATISFQDTMSNLDVIKSSGVTRPTTQLHPTVTPETVKSSVEPSLKPNVDSESADSLSMSRERHEEREIDSEERKYWQDFKIRMETMKAVNRTDFGRVDHVIRKTNDTVEVECVSVGLTIKFNQRYIKTQVSPWYHGLQCGLCGEYDGEQTNDLVGPEGLSYDDSQIFGITYRVSDVKLCSLVTEMFECLPKMKTIVIDDVILDNVESTCFSKIPVPRCDSCTPTKRHQELIEFSCLEKNSGTRYMTERAENEVITKVSYLKTDIVSVVDTQLKCVK
ncbi:vitellogenin-4-like [Antedon mediterranea]|uniref:vitellogenin-4-like n=1 Tax=Antedon mediterranea TaxID=105859 RepID=UPI003AF46831